MIVVATIAISLFGHAHAAQAWDEFAGDPQHTAISEIPAMPLQDIRWQTPIDLAPPAEGSYLNVDYGSPIVTAENTVVVPVKTQSEGGFELKALDGDDGSLLWSATPNYVLPPHDWIPAYSPAISANNRVYFAGAGGTIHYRNNVNSPSDLPVHVIAFYGTAEYMANRVAFNSSVFIDTPITTDASGDVFFGYRVTGSNPMGLTSGIARISPTGAATYISVAAASAGDNSVTTPVMNCAPALSNNGKTLYICLGNGSPVTGGGDLVSLNSTTLKPRVVVHLTDPASGQTAYLPDDGTASPMIGPDGDVYIGALGDPTTSNHGRGWMLHFSQNLSLEKIPGAFGWDDTASVVPSSMVPSYAGPSSYLIMTKDNNYAEDGGNGINKLAILDPNAIQEDAATGASAMKQVETVKGPTPDPSEDAAHPGADKEWCVNSAVVDPATDSVLANSEDGTLYDWNLGTDTLSESIQLTNGVGEAYTPTLIAADGSVLAIQNSTLYDVGIAPPSVAFVRSVPLPPAIWDGAAILVLLGLMGRLRRHRVCR